MIFFIPFRFLRIKERMTNCQYPGCLKQIKIFEISCSKHKCVVCEHNFQNPKWNAFDNPLRKKCEYCQMHKCLYCDRRATSLSDGTCCYCVVCEICGSVNFSARLCSKHHCTVPGCEHRAHFGDETMCIFHTYQPDCEYRCSI